MAQLAKNLMALNSKETKPILKMLEEQWGFTQKLDYAFLKGKDDNIYIVNNDITRIDIASLRINSAGLYIGQLKGNGIRLSIEGSQLVGPHATKNVLEIDDKLAWHWMKGIDIPYPEDRGADLKGFQILKEGSDYLGCGIFKENRILNFVPKVRRLFVDERPCITQDDDDDE